MLGTIARQGLNRSRSRPRISDDRLVERSGRAGPMGDAMARANRRRSKIRFVEHVFAQQKSRIGLFVHTIGIPGHDQDRHGQPHVPLLPRRYDRDSGRAASRRVARHMTLQRAERRRTRLLRTRPAGYVQPSPWLAILSVSPKQHGHPPIQAAVPVRKTSANATINTRLELVSSVSRMPAIVDARIEQARRSDTPMSACRCTTASLCTGPAVY